MLTQFIAFVFIFPAVIVLLMGFGHKLLDKFL